MCWAHFEFFCNHGGVIRLYADGQSDGDLYCFALPFRVVDDQTIELKGLWCRPRQCQVRAIAKSCRESGLQVIRERKDGANPGTKRYR